MPVAPVCSTATFGVVLGDCAATWAVRWPSGGSDARVSRSEVIDTPEDVSLVPLVATLADAGHLDEAVRAARTEVNDPGLALYTVAARLVATDDLDQALAIAREIAALDVRRAAEQLVADAMVEVGHQLAAIRVPTSYGTDALLDAYIRWAPP